MCLLVGPSVYRSVHPFVTTTQHCKSLPSIRICRLKSGQNKKLTLKNGMNESPSAPKKYLDKFSYLCPAVLCRLTACIQCSLRILKSRWKKIEERNLRSFTVVISCLNAWFLSVMNDYRNRTFFEGGWKIIDICFALVYFPENPKSIWDYRK